MNFFNQLECTMVNGEIPYKYQTNKQKTIKGNKSYSLNLSIDLEEYEDKRFKADYLTLQIKFVDKLKYLSIELKNH